MQLLYTRTHKRCSFREAFITPALLHTSHFGGLNSGALVTAVITGPTGVVEKNTSSQRTPGKPLQRHCRNRVCFYCGWIVN
ncbi:hypothetical protein L798_08635 [Zootermopsis nevadensis]|uniref:Uncharacterized protein n=1 Tax=Zootermopsis nevadensis TaxID=136037 RepID=A0A067R208_ZOONE|nr:hypothetical protein L798_08635 [Zootermopsis nevadensis]